MDKVQQTELNISRFSNAMHYAHPRLISSVALHIISHYRSQAGLSNFWVKVMLNFPNCNDIVRCFVTKPETSPKNRLCVLSQMLIERYGKNLEGYNICYELLNTTPKMANGSKYICQHERWVGTPADDGVGTETPSSKTRIPPRRASIHSELFGWFSQKWSTGSNTWITRNGFTMNIHSFIHSFYSVKAQSPWTTKNKTSTNHSYKTGKGIVRKIIDTEKLDKNMIGCSISRSEQQKNITNYSRKQ